jgi:hypothetical protein
MVDILVLIACFVATPLALVSLPVAITYYQAHLGKNVVDRNGKHWFRFILWLFSFACGMLFSILYLLKVAHGTGIVTLIISLLFLTAFSLFTTDKTKKSAFVDSNITLYTGQVLGLYSLMAAFLLILAV